MHRLKPETRELLITIQKQFDTYEHSITHLEIGNGWVQLVDDLINDLLSLGWHGAVAQIKEKFGGLRFYAYDLTEEMRQRVRDAEGLSYKTCEVCGKLGKNINNNGWSETLCQDCMTKNNIVDLDENCEEDD